jgi:arsenate reductase
MIALVYHNQRCSNSRGALALLEHHGINYEVKNYLNEPMTVDELLNLSLLCNLPLEQLIRKKEDPYLNFKNRSMTNKDWALAIVEYPVLLQRPIVLYKQKGIVARPPEKVLEIL